MDDNEEVLLQCVLHVSGDAKHRYSVSFEQTWETVEIIAKPRKKHLKRAKKKASEEIQVS